MTQLTSTSGILYVRAALKPFARQIKSAGGVPAFLKSFIDHEELLVPYFRRARSFWERQALGEQPSNSGALGTQVASIPGAVVSRHPSHRFTGTGPRIADVLDQHDQDSSCFFPIGELAKRHDFSMLLLGCVDESPGFSTVHVVQNEFGLTRRHLIRYLLRWDFDGPAGRASKVAIECPGCSLSFGKFYPAYETDGNLVRGEFWGSKYLFVPSARKAMAAERKLLEADPRFVDCGRLACSTCRLRTY